MITQPFILIVGVFLIVFILIVAVILPRVFNKTLQELKARYSNLQQELSSIFSDRDAEKRQLRLQKFSSMLDNFIGKVLTYYGCYDKSVNQQIRIAMQKKLITYDDFKIVKEFHHMRNRIVHEDHSISSSEEQLIYSTISIVGRLVR